MNSEDVEVATQLVAVLRLLLELKKKKSKRRTGVLEVWRRRTEQGDGYNLIEELRFNEALFFKYTRMNYDR